MNRKRGCHAVGWLVTAAILAVLPACVQAASEPIDVSKLHRTGTVDERFLSYNVEMVEVIGGWFWKPYGAKKNPSTGKETGSSGAAIPAGMDPALYEYRPPIDLSNVRLRKLAGALGPAYVRVSGTWANSVFFQDSDEAPTKAPAGFGGVLTRPQWKGVVDFARAVDAKIVTSFATSPGTRDAAGVWTPDQARRVLAFTRSIGGTITAAEYMNEPTYAAMGGAPKGYDAATFGRDVKVFRRFVQEAAPGLLFLGPGSVGEGGPSPMTMGSGMLNTPGLLEATGPAFDAFSYHLYAAVSKRCAGLGPATQTTAAGALSEDWLSRADAITSYYARQRDRFEPGKPLWITETADAACGGNPWASTFLDTFRYLDWLGRLARQGVQVIAHNTLASSDYGLLDPMTYAPRPNFWAALLWKKLMGATVLDPGPTPDPTVHVYAHCQRDGGGGVALLAINLDQRAAHHVIISARSTRYTLTAARLLDRTVQLNAKELQASAGGDVPRMEGVPTPAGRIVLPPVSVTFISVREASNPSCQ